MLDAELVERERRGKNAAVGVPAELVAVVAAGGDLESADPRATEPAEHRDRRTCNKGLAGVEIHVSFPGRLLLEVVLGGAAVQRNRHGGFDVDVAHLAEARRFEELEDERWQRTQHQLDVCGGRGMTRIDENVEPRRVDIADVGEIDDKCRRPA